MGVNLPDRVRGHVGNSLPLKSCYILHRYHQKSPETKRVNKTHTHWKETGVRKSVFGGECRGSPWTKVASKSSMSLVFKHFM